MTKGINDKNLNTLFKNYIVARKQLLKAIGCTNSNRDPLSELSEHIAKRLLGGELAASRVQKDFDLIRKNGKKVQVKYLANSLSKWINEHKIEFKKGMDEYALIIFENLYPKTLICFKKEFLSEVCKKLRKSHSNQSTTLQFTQKNYNIILSDKGTFESVGMEVFSVKYLL